jgi:hypothetical protein
LVVPLLLVFVAVVQPRSLWLVLVLLVPGLAIVFGGGVWVVVCVVTIFLVVCRQLGVVCFDGFFLSVVVVK